MEDDTPQAMAAKQPLPLWIFDRERINHPWQQAFLELRSTSDPGRFWVASNWRLDHRVSEEREVSDLLSSGHFNHIADAEDWWVARGRYFVAEICRPSRPVLGRKLSAYLRPMNRANLISDPPADFDRLVHVASLDALLFRLSQGDALEGAADFELELSSIVGFPWRFESTLSRSSPAFLQTLDQLVQSLLAQGEETVRRLAALLVEALGHGEPPWWACFAQEIQETLEAADAARLCSALGLGHRTEGEWLLTWNYPVADAGALYRPTVLEANDSPYHHPSPPHYRFGITMPLNPDQPACREVLHRPLRGRAAVEGCTGRLLRLERFADMGDRRRLGALRSRHRERLRREFSTDGLDLWIGRHPEPPESP